MSVRACIACASACAKGTHTRSPGPGSVDHDYHAHRSAHPNRTHPDLKCNTNLARPYPKQHRSRAVFAEAVDPVPCSPAIPSLLLAPHLPQEATASAAFLPRRLLGSVCICILSRPAPTFLSSSSFPSLSPLLLEEFQLKFADAIIPSAQNTSTSLRSKRARERKETGKSNRAHLHQHDLATSTVARASARWPPNSYDQPWLSWPPSRSWPTMRKSDHKLKFPTGSAIQPWS